MIPPILLADFVRNFGIIFGMFTGIIVFWHNMVTVPREKKEDARNKKEDYRMAQQEVRDKETAQIQKEMLQAQNDNNLLMVRQNEQTLHQNDLRVKEIERMNELIMSVDERLDKSYKALDGRIILVEGKIFGSKEK